MGRRKVHLTAKHGRTACGLEVEDYLASEEPQKVNCWACCGTVAMADAEARFASESRWRRRGSRPRRVGRT